jgi:hypothetical protein
VERLLASLKKTYMQADEPGDEHLALAAVELRRWLDLHPSVASDDDAPGPG